VNFRVRWGAAQWVDVEGEVTEISAGGCFVRSEKVVNEGDLIQLTIRFPDQGEVTLWGNVAYWAMGVGFGLRFAAFTQGGAREKLEEMLAAEARKATTPGE
jgi:hypothetical protein